MTEIFRVRLLGPFRVDGATPAISQRAKGLIAYLAMHADRSISRDTLATLLWSDGTSQRSRQSLRQCLTDVRMALGRVRESLESTRAAVRFRLSANADIDVHHFEALAQSAEPDDLAAASDLYRGEFLEALDINSERFAEWLTIERSRLASIASDTLRRLALLRSQAGDTASAIASAQRLLSLDPLREDGHRILMNLYAADGRRSDALRQFARCREIMRRELGVEPDGETVALAERIKTSTGALPATSVLVHKPKQTMGVVGGNDRDQRRVKTSLREGIRSLRARRQGFELADEEPASTELQQGESSEPGHRRRLTVMACVLSDDTGSLIRLDPEERHSVLSAFRIRANDICARLGGTAGPMAGDTTCFYFGYPAAHEHDAEYAIRAGLAVLEAVPHLATNKNIRLGLRVGIASGDVVVTDPLDGTAGREPAIIGEAPEVAARLAGAAEVGVLVAAATTRSLARDLFDYRELPDPGRTSAQSFRVLGETRLGSRFDALHPGGLTALVGRREEIARMLNRWREARAGTGRIVLISGEPGIGKSRLVRELRDQIKVDNHAYIALSCAPHQKDTPYQPFVRFLESAAAIFRQDQAPVRLNKLETLLSQASNGPEATILLANLLSIETHDRYAPLALSPRQRRHRTITVLVQQILTLADRVPLIIAFEDVHWIDPTSCEVLDMLVNSIANLPVLLVITFRPEFTAPWVSHPFAMTIVLNRLDQRAARRLVEQLGGISIPEHIRAGVLERADGVPLFLEELTKSVLENGAEDGLLPASLHDLLMERLDRLSPEAKRVAQVGSAIGRSFSHELLAAVAGQPDAILSDALNQLLASALLTRTDDPPDATYLFKHALVQTAAYGSMLRSVRASIHRQLAEELQLQEPGIAESKPDLLAFHCEHAGLTEQAASCYTAAGWQALDRAGFREALDQFNNALRMATLLPETEARNLAELRAVQGLGFALGRSAGYASTAYGAASERALLLCERLGYPPEYIGANFRYCDFQLSRGNLNGALGSAMRLSNWGEVHGDLRALVIGRTNAGRALLAQGELTAARGQLEQAYELYEANRDNQSAVWTLRVALTRSVLLSHLLGNLALVTCWMGSPEKALALLSTADQPHEPELEASVVAKPLVRWYRLLVLSFLAEPFELLGPTQELAVVSDEQGLPTFIAWATAMRGYAMVGRGDPRTSRALITEGLAGYLSTRAELWSCYFRVLLADAQTIAGNPDVALDILKEALDNNNRTGERWCDAEVLRRMGEAHRKHGNDREAEQCFHRAIHLARAAGARLWELTAASSYGRLLSDRGEHEKAHALLAPIYFSFSEGIQTFPLRRASMVLGEVSTQWRTGQHPNLNRRSSGTRKWSRGVNRDGTKD